MYVVLIMQLFEPDNELFGDSLHGKDGNRFFLDDFPKVLP